MHERVNEIIGLLMLEISRHQELQKGHIAIAGSINLTQLSSELLEQGYTEPEIRKAVEWIIMNLNKTELARSIRSHDRRIPSIRVLISEEQNFFTPDAYGHLIQLQSLGILDALQVEQVIERCFMVGLAKIDLEELKIIVTQVLLGEGMRKDHPTNYHPGNDLIN